ncbi:helix-turn-helix domain-containing protein [Alteripontixanthobacter muriae]|uniref:helix-turn-helix domain-containing protein n=1 Tax=Alteripontixanthobacter muriae TaxID=2705546 RepID=UPI001E5C896C|nr:helix-turn-helix domain-containing protein [Alteripontixanthobacter muriae]
MGELPPHTGRAREPRRRITLEGSGTLSSGAPMVVTIHNISETGMLIECQHALVVGETLAIDLPGAETTSAKVVWLSGHLQGCQFVNPISKAVLSAAQLRSAVGQEVDTSASRDARSAEPFGVRLQRLRKESGLTLEQVAAELGVSKPTVWAWEQGRTRPIRERMDLLAQVLGTSSSALLSGQINDPLGEVLERSRRQIADAYGTGLNNVRIMIEL